MKGEVKGLKTLIMKESPSAYYVHCFAHQLQLMLVAVAKGDVGASNFFATFYPKDISKFGVEDT
jgi:hypothetical protein